MSANILFIEDSPVVQTVVDALLKKTYSVSKAGSLVEARRRLIEKQPDLIILDAELPDGDGFSFCSLLRKDEKYKNVPILILTGRIDDEEKEFAMKMGAADYVKKPFDNADLLERVQRLLAK